MKVKADILAQERELLAVFAEVRRDNQTLRVEGLGHRLQRPAGEPATRSYSLTGWNDIVAYHPADLVVTVEAGMSVKALNRILAEHGQWIPLTVADGQDDTVGGAVSAGLDGIWRGGYGSFRDRVLGLRVLTPGFGAIQVGAAVVKNVAGYNLSRLFFGSRGTLGIITQVTLKVSPLPQSRRYWAWEGSLSEMSAKANDLMGWATPWAGIAFIADPSQKGTRLWAAWHGVAETVDYLAATKEPGSPDLPLMTRPWKPGAVTLKGAVPRKTVQDVIGVWENGLLAVEWQSGGFLGTLSEEDAPRMENWIRERSGGVAVLSGLHEDLPVPPALMPIWKRLKDAYDPQAILG